MWVAAGRRDPRQRRLRHQARPRRLHDRPRTGRRRHHILAVADIADDHPGHHQLLVRRNRRTGELAFCRCYSATRVPLPTLVRVTGHRWRVEETFQSGKGPAGLDEHQVRGLTSWHRWVTLTMLAHAFLTVVRADEHARHPRSDELVPLTCNEIQRLFAALVIRPGHSRAHRLDWSHWRRRHKASIPATTAHKPTQP
ncbi:transposase [Actinomadura violacea]|uniref:Transposase n=1 Tax=Actinomadura violacea TaxID=2819934 RepID=A0ABS3RYT2_9ACTN|nr:transposase [Actinomadura violacea]MBO2461453.1 transposase [Actinomadura violacea]